MTQKKKEPVKLRQKPLANGNASLYLDIYMNGRRSYEFLSLYLIPEKNASDRLQNKETLALAEKVRIRRMAELQSGRMGFKPKTAAPLLHEWVMDVYRFKLNAGFRENSAYDTLGKYIADYDSKVRVDEAGFEWCTAFKCWLDARDGKRSGSLLAHNTKTMMLVMLKAAFAEAVKREMIEKNPMSRLPLSLKETERTFLTLEELRVLSNTPTRYEKLKRSFMFGCLTGLRKSDIERLHWDNVSCNGGVWRITFSQKKTGGLLYLDINEQAVQYMGERHDGLVFGNIEPFTNGKDHLKEWAASAGIHKPITFHSSRHTFAVLMLSLGTDIYTLSKLLGHKDVKTTQIYAKVLDSTRRDAVAKIPKII